MANTKRNFLKHPATLLSAGSILGIILGIIGYIQIGFQPQLIEDPPDGVQIKNDLENVSYPTPTANKPTAIDSKVALKVFFTWYFNSCQGKVPEGLRIYMAGNSQYQYFIIAAVASDGSDNGYWRLDKDYYNYPNPKDIITADAAKMEIQTYWKSVSINRKGYLNGDQADFKLSRTYDFFTEVVQLCRDNISSQLDPYNYSPPPTDYSINFEHGYISSNRAKKLYRHHRQYCAGDITTYNGKTTFQGETCLMSITGNGLQVNPGIKNPMNYKAVYNEVGRPCKPCDDAMKQ